MHESSTVTYTGTLWRYLGVVPLWQRRTAPGRRSASAASTAATPARSAAATPRKPESHLRLAVPGSGGLSGGGGRRRRPQPRTAPAGDTPRNRPRTLSPRREGPCGPPRETIGPWKRLGAHETVEAGAARIPRDNAEALRLLGSASLGRTVFTRHALPTALAYARSVTDHVLLAGRSQVQTEEREDAEHHAGGYGERACRLDDAAGGVLA